MGRVLLVARLVRRDLRRRPAQAVLLLLAITAATTVLTLALALQGVTGRPAGGSSALARALGATRRQLSASVAAAQLLPAIPGAILGVPLGLGLFVAASGAGPTGTTIPSAGWLIPAVLVTFVAVTALTAIPAWAGARRPVIDVLTQEA